ncbi:hypothetical protein A2154_00425 [Candidatus Gottesmanbacteria bacterium RBG_16_43_7]|uniref:Metal-dependent hydrolase n=1 Tax=Candidatus Gottesmanbacteria bacterium RBG_16_43_7 TaxID=1798373 RepID=A0A1F5Z8J2_9BACT|nr:MAG: hypothetical protein A2154_00425 [Candidatus Gottesmanbacteria bacterium RBG_16_43_7]
MTARTHDLAALTGLTFAIAFIQLPQITMATAVTAFAANMIGGLLPDIDDATSDFWDTIRLGNLVSKIINPLIDNHRKITHSLIGMTISGFILHYLLQVVGKVLIVDMDIVWWSMMIGYASHLVMDSFTKEGVPWLLPLPVRIGFPPIRALRITTGKLTEKALVFPGLILVNGYLIYNYYPTFLGLFGGLTK